MKISQLRVQQSSIDPDKARAVYGVYQYEQSIHESTIMRHKDIAQRAGDLITSPGQVSHANGYMLERGIIDARRLHAGDPLLALGLGSIQVYVRHSFMTEYAHKWDRAADLAKPYPFKYGDPGLLEWKSVRLVYNNLRARLGDGTRTDMFKVSDLYVPELGVNSLDDSLVRVHILVAQGLIRVHKVMNGVVGVRILAEYDGGEPFRVPYIVNPANPEQRKLNLSGDFLNWKLSGDFSGVDDGRGREIFAEPAPIQESATAQHWVGAEFGFEPDSEKLEPFDPWDGSQAVAAAEFSGEFGIEALYLMNVIRDAAPIVGELRPDGRLWVKGREGFADFGRVLGWLNPGDRMAIVVRLLNADRISVSRDDGFYWYALNDPVGG